MVKQAAVDLELQPEDNFILKVLLCFYYWIINHILYIFYVLYNYWITKYITFDAANGPKYMHRLWTFDVTVMVLPVCDHGMDIGATEMGSMLSK
jgi:hypothetical protein